MLSDAPMINPGMWGGASVGGWAGVGVDMWWIPCPEQVGSVAEEGCVCVCVCVCDGLAGPAARA